MNAAAPARAEPTLADQIAQVERRLELRRERTVRHVTEARADVERAKRWLPLAGVAGALALGLVVGRRPDARGDAPPEHRSAAGQAARTGILASFVALAGTAVRIALSPQARALWTAYRNHRHGGPAR